MKPARIAIPEPTSTSADYNQRTWPQYAHAIRCCGGIAVPIPLDSNQASVARVISGCCGFLLPGSPADLDPQKYGQSAEAETAPSDPEREAVDELLLQDAFNLRKPLLGICYGLQALNVWRNGTLRQHIRGDLHSESTMDRVHCVTMSGGSRTASALIRSGDPKSAEIWVNSSHHQSVQIPGDGMQIVAFSSDDGVPEAVELVHSQQYAVGVQWHPERTFGTDRCSKGLFQSFVDAASAWTLKPVTDSVVFPAPCPI